MGLHPCGYKDLFRFPEFVNALNKTTTTTSTCPRPPHCARSQAHGLDAQPQLRPPDLERHSPHTMERTMNTDHPFPVPMHRPSITLDSQYDKPLPFRRTLEQVTELNAETAIPYKMPAERRLSNFERLPFEIRQRIYNYLGYSLANMTHDWQKRAEDYRPRPFFYRGWAISDNVFDILGEFEKNMLYLNRNLRDEALDIVFRHAEAKLDYCLSEKRIFKFQ
jgi:hypothetical protein